MKHATKRQKPSRIDVNKSLLEWAMKRSGKSVSDLAKNENLKKLNEWMKGTIKPTRTQLEEFVRSTYTPFGWLLLPEPPQEHPSPIPHFRTASGNSQSKRSINLEDTIRIIEQRQEWACEYLIETGEEPLEFVGSCDVDNDPVEISKRIKNTLSLDADWTESHSKWEDVQKYLLEKVESARIFVSRNSMVQNNHSRPLDADEFRGFVLVDKYAPFVFVNSSDFAGAQMFTLAHELAHIWIGKSASFDLRGLTANTKIKLERVCNQIAAEFLVPTEEILQCWNHFSRNSNDPYKAIADHFKVSQIVAARRALDTQCISQSTFSKFYFKYKQHAEESKRQQINQKNHPSFYTMAQHRAGKRFLQTVIEAVGERRLLYRNAYALTGLKSNTFDSLKAEMGRY